MAATATDGEPEIVREYVRLVGERKGDGEYYLHGLPAGRDFRKEKSYDVQKASALKIEGVGFAAESFELSEHETLIRVEQDTPAGMARITFEEM